VNPGGEKGTGGWNTATVHLKLKREWEKRRMQAEERMLIGGAKTRKGNEKKTVAFSYHSYGGAKKHWDGGP